MIRIKNTFYIILHRSNDIKIKEDDHRIFYKNITTKFENFF